MDIFIDRLDHADRLEYGVLDNGRFLMKANPGGGRRRQKEAQTRARRVLKLHVEDGLTYSEIAEKEHITRQRVGQIVNQALKDVAAERHSFAKRLHHVRTEQLRKAKYELFKIMRMPCPACLTQLTLLSPEPRVGLPGCERCNGDGHRYGVNARLRAINAFVRTVELESRLVPIPPQSDSQDDRTDLIADILEKLQDPAAEEAYLEPLGEPTGQPNPTPPEGSSAVVGQESVSGDPAEHAAAVHEAEAVQTRAVPDVANESDRSEEASGDDHGQDEEQADDKRSKREPYHGWPEGRMTDPSPYRGTAPGS